MHIYIYICTYIFINEGRKERVLMLLWELMMAQKSVNLLAYLCCHY